MHDFDVNQRRYNALMICGILLPLLLYRILSSIFVPATTDMFHRLWYSRILIWAVLGLLFLFSEYGECQPFSLIPAIKQKFLFAAVSVIVLVLLSWLCGIIAATARLFRHIDSNLVARQVMQVTHQHFSLAIVTCVTAGITEELIFRGYILTRLTVLIRNKYLPVIISALIFSLIHMAYKSLRELIFAFGIGIVYGCYYQKYRNLYPTIIAHILVDAVAVSLYR